MAAFMRILGWRAKGLRCPDHEIKCVDSSEHPFHVSLIQMPNATGKTTTLAMLRAALSGSAENWARDKVSEYRKRDSLSQDGYFELRLLISTDAPHNCKRATILMEFDFENGCVSYKTTYGSGQSDGFNPPLIRFMNTKFVKFYVFDGELAQQLLDREHTDAQVVVEVLFQMNTFDEMATRIDQYWHDKIRTKKNPAYKMAGLTRQKNQLEALKKRLANCKREQQDLKEKQAKLKDKLKKKEDTFEQEIKKHRKLSQDLHNAQIEVHELTRDVWDKALEVLDRMRDPHALSSSLADSMLTFKEGLDKVKLPERAAREFFVDLANEPECVCGRPVNDEIAETIRLRADIYLGNDNIALLNSMKELIRDLVDSVDEAEKDLNIKLDSLKTYVEKRHSARQDHSALKSQAENADPAVQSVSEDIDVLKSELKDIDTQLSKYENEDQSSDIKQIYSIKILEKMKKDAEEKLSDITQTQSEKAKCDKLRAIISAAHEKARTKVTTELCEQVNKRISGLMPHNRISIEGINRNLILAGQDDGSVGETLSIAYAFLATMFHSSECRIPFVVDSPVGPIDFDIRRQVGELIPRLTDQFIAFTISAEREDFVEPLKRASEGNIQFITLFRKGAKQLEREAREKGTVLETEDGLNVSGEDFFNIFLEEEA